METSAKPHLSVAGPWIAVTAGACNTVSLLKNDSRGCRPVSNLYVPHPLVISAVRLSPCANFLAIAAHSPHSNPAVLIWKTETKQSLIRLELPIGIRWEKHCPLELKWVPTATSHMLVVRINRCSVVLYEFHMGYCRLKRRRILRFDGLVERVEIVPFRDHGYALVTRSEKSFSAYAIPEGSLLFRYNGDEIEAVVEIIANSIGFFAVALVKSRGPHKHHESSSSHTNRIHHGTATNPSTQMSTAGLSWAVVGGNGLAELTHVPETHATMFLHHEACAQQSRSLVGVTNTGVVLAFDPYVQREAVFEHHLPTECTAAICRENTFELCASLVDSSVILVHTKSHTNSDSDCTELCMHRIRDPRRFTQEHCKGRTLSRNTSPGETPTTSPIDYCSVKTGTLQSSSHPFPLSDHPKNKKWSEYPSHPSPTLIPPLLAPPSFSTSNLSVKASSLVSVQLKLPVRSQIAHTPLRLPLRGHGKQAVSRLKRHQTCINERDVRSIPLRLPLRKKRALGDITNIGANLTLSRTGRTGARWQRTRKAPPRAQVSRPEPEPEPSASESSIPLRLPIVHRKLIARPNLSQSFTDH